MLLFVPCAPVPLLAQEAPADAKALLQSAYEVSGLRQVLPYEVHAVVVVHPGSPDEVKGQITIYRDKDRSRAELQVERYSETRLVLGNRLYRNTPVAAEPEIQIMFGGGEGGEMGRRR